jgi:hypothetical protein
VLFGQSHGRIKTYDGKPAGHFKDFFNYRLPHLLLEHIQLGSVIPGHYGTIVSMIDVAGFPVFLFATETPLLHRFC